MELSHLQTFLLLAKNVVFANLSFTSSQPAVSQQIKTLEELGQVLFVRHSHSTP